MNCTRGEEETLPQEESWTDAEKLGFDCVAEAQTKRNRVPAAGGFEAEEGDKKTLLVTLGLG